jgi:sugar phosphate permease
MDWRLMLWVAAAIGAGLVIIASLFIRECPPVVVQVSSTDSENKYISHPFYQTTLKEALVLFFKSKQFLLICGSMMGLTILWDFLNFVPLYLNESLSMSTADAALATSSFPIGSLVSVLVGGFIFDKLSRKTVTKIMAIYLGIAVSSLLFILYLPQFPLLSAQQKIYATLAALFIFGFMVSPAYYLPMSIFSIEFGGPHSGFLIALLDAIGFGASVAFSFVGGRMAGEAGGWVRFLTLLIAIAIFSWGITVWFLKGESNAKSQ